MTVRKVTTWHIEGSPPITLEAGVVKLDSIVLTIAHTEAMAEALKLADAEPAKPEPASVVEASPGEPEHTQLYIDAVEKGRQREASIRQVKAMGQQTVPAGEMQQ